ncbi:ECF-type sigma factor [Tuwongella immobilis]|uniref:RNA polymerase sigma-70 ECF-like HTH domain-containing protein n=1 Tax=Tuwongella immobilis TaxID=692036 RepID=A0A6C2YSB2_9BACT|nr:ECF-type sigma factor [Tuwongella immobilis]VIP04356.1 rna polymerase sigma-70 ecf-like protein : DNA-directed RNA polymerase specialized sigma subunit, sigma24 OS=Singulisphaera acidiphila (strain ATCC BAA-1392 / DSM 18658 / VKM B-2454 / MOB10) GN=Sinac_1052 PE=4 SV=1: Sigma70_ECF [Tuwongella immobilis]VTS06074.1 rna polymerase sigma-70 ecf-like protein : DNA-directed RNA polymerase specialized sigma subunit, sigma24 OS=Singulisphaera acidiphila (strain ATCC BAA-1392 / DSM 18658 / VKM B-2454 
MEPSPSVTTWIGQLRAGDLEAAQPLWERYFRRLLGLARQQLTGTDRRAADEEDVALSAFHSFCQAVKDDRFPRLDDRQDLWQILVMLTARKAHQERRRQWTLKRGGIDADEGKRVAPPESDFAIEELIGSEPDPAWITLMAEQCEFLMQSLPDDELRRIARLRFEGYTVDEIAQKLGIRPRSIERKLALIRGYWNDAIS